ncbi:MAG: hypothetical protein K2Y21_07095 [Phycisphaerales bacterium]|nr:hypothetical protein [Phycisphaerales bacterium]
MRSATLLLFCSLSCSTLLLASCGESAAPAPAAPRFVQEQHKKVEEFKAQRGIGAEPAKLSVNDRLLTELRRVRAALAQYGETFKGAPWLPGQVESDQWSSLAFDKPPANPLSPSKVSTKVIEITRKGQTGAAADPNEAGWVWNSVDGKVFAAGSDE